MNFVFWLLAFLAMVALWFLFAFAFPGIGRFFRRIYQDAVEQINDKNKNDKGDN